VLTEMLALRRLMTASDAAAADDDDAYRANRFSRR